MFEAEVKAGVEYLDVIFPDGWRQRINTRVLNMASNCILEQATGLRYHRAASLLNLPHEKAVEYGFDIMRSSVNESLDAGRYLGELANMYAQLGTAWLNELTPKNDPVGRSKP